MREKVGSDLWASGGDVGRGEVHDGPLAGGGRAALHLRLSLRGGYLHGQVNGGEARRHGARRGIVVVHWSAKRFGRQTRYPWLISILQIHLTISFLGQLQLVLSYCIVLCQS